MKNILVGFTCVFALLSSSSVFASSKVGLALDQGFGVVGQFRNISGFVGNDGASIDYIFRQGGFGKEIPLKWHVGAGTYYNWSGDENLGLRAPLGLALHFAKNWDVFGQIIPVWDLELEHDDLEFKVDFAIGIRYAF